MTSASSFHDTLKYLDVEPDEEADKATDDILSKGDKARVNFQSNMMSLDTTQRFTTFPMLMEYIKDHSKSGGFILTQKPKQHFSKDSWPFDFPCKSFVAKRGWCVCSPRFLNRIAKSPCPYKIVYGWSKRTSSYQINPVASILTHKHSLVDESPTFGDREQVKYESDLTNDKWSYIRIQVLSKINVPNMHNNLERSFKKRCYHYKFIQRVCKKILDEFCGKDRAQLNLLFMNGDTTRRLGGLFEIEPSKDFGLAALHIQTFSIKKYDRMYPLFSQGDGIHSLSGHPFVFVFFLTINCLMMSQFVGTTACLTESSAPIIAGAKKFFNSPISSSEKTTIEVGEFPGMFNPWVDSTYVSEDPDSNTAPPTNMKPTLMTDKGPAFPILAEAMGWHHLLDCQHFKNKIALTWNKPEDPAQYRSDTYSILDEPCPEKLCTLLKAALAKYITLKAHAYIKKIADHKKQSCYAFASNHFTAGHWSTQQSEGGMLSMKANGKLKETLKKSTLSETCDRIQQVC